mgnify:CR=1 FL=1
MSFLNKPFPKIEQKKYNNIFGNIHFAIILILLIIFSMNIKIAYVPSLSMYPTMDINEYMCCLETNNFNYGDIVLFHPPTSPSDEYVKRVIGAGGDTISIHDGRVWRNGEALDEPYIAEEILYDMDEIQIPDGEYFLMGDNRNHSMDSHAFGTVPEESIHAKCLFHFNPPILLGLQLSLIHI